jgi:hypothetical protein
MSRLKQLSARLLLGTIPLLALLLLGPRTPAYADPFVDAFSAIFSTVTTLGNYCTSIQGASQSILNLRMSTIYPIAVIQQHQQYINTIINTYRPWMNQVFNQPVTSAQTPKALQLDSAIHSGTSTGTSNLLTPYHATYGTPMSSHWAPPLTYQATDMNDAHTVDTLSLATSTDQSATTLISLANQLEDQSATTAAGTADMITAQGLALQLQSLAMQHNLLAADLRQEAAALAAMNTEVKNRVTNAQNINGVIPNLLQKAAQQ